MRPDPERRHATGRVPYKTLGSFLT
jgi:hypothetical protein